MVILWGVHDSVFNMRVGELTKPVFNLVPLVSHALDAVKSLNQQPPKTRSRAEPCGVLRAGSPAKAQQWGRARPSRYLVPGLERYSRGDMISIPLKLFSLFRC